jgi:DsbC/DsbD-like thiol-disulfide interchange protein
MRNNRSHAARVAATAAARIAALAIVLLASAAAAAAEVASAWDESLSSRARLVAGQVATATGSDPFAGIEIRLDEGYKTYWRNPGDAGIPPRFDWTGSVNLAAAEVLYPAPHRLADPGGQSIGYNKAVIFPVRLTPTDPAAPIRIALKLDYAACASLCVPAEASLRLTVPAGADLPSRAIEEALGRVPRQVDGAADMPRVVDLSVDGKGKERKISITVAQPQGAEDADLFVEGPADWYLPLPEPGREPENRAERRIAYGIALDGLPKSATLSGEKLRLTVVNATDAVEQEWTLR